MLIPLWIIIVSAVAFALFALSLVYLVTKNTQFHQSLAQYSLIDQTSREAQSKANQFESLAHERKGEIDRLNNDLSTLRLRIDQETQAKTELATELAGVKAQSQAEKESAQEKITLLSEMRAELELKFKSMAADALKTQGEQFSKSNLERLEATLSPLKEHVTKFESELKEINKETIKERENLKGEVQNLSRRSQEISQEAIALTRALKGDQQKQGAWGERILESILEKSGLRQGEEYHTQAHRTGEDGKRLRPDVVVKMPGNKTLIIDSKVSLVAYSDAVNAQDEETATAARKRHTFSLHTHIKELSSKQYHNAETNSVDYVVMFIPIEGALSEALREDGSIAETALEKHITIATPTTLMMALRTVAHVWAAERRNVNAEKIAEDAGKMYDKVAGFIDSMNKVGNAIGQANTHYQTAYKQLATGKGNLLSRAENLKTLGVKTQKSIAIEFEGTNESITDGEFSLNTDKTKEIT